MRGKSGPLKAKDLQNLMPFFTWVVRDFELGLVNDEGEQISQDEYLEQSLAEKESLDDDVAKQNNIRKCLRTCFLHRSCFTLCKPVESRN